MADANTEIDLDALHAAIIAGISGKFPDLNVEAYREDRERLILPACLVELVDMEPDPDSDPGTGQLAVLARFEARIVIGFKKLKAKQEIRKMAAALAAAIYMQRWGQPIGPAEVTTITPDNFSPELDQFEVWRVDWQHLIHLGASVWNNDGTIPRQVWASISPEIGPDYINSYKLIAGDPE